MEAERVTKTFSVEYLKNRPCRICGALAVPEARIISLCDACVKRINEKQAAEAKGIIENACQKHNVGLNDKQKQHIVRYINENPQLNTEREIESLVKTQAEAKEKAREGIARE